MATLPGIDEKMIRLNPEWSVENAATTALEQSLSVNDFKGKRLIVTLPGAGGFCNKELDLIKDNMGKFKEAGTDEVIIVVLPAPFRPITPTTSPRSTSNDAPFRAQMYSDCAVGMPDSKSPVSRRNDEVNAFASTSRKE